MLINYPDKEGHEWETKRRREREGSVSWNGTMARWYITMLDVEKKPGRPNFGPESDDDEDSEEECPLLAERQGDVISSHRALLTLMKAFVGSGCLSLPYAWKQGGLWVSFVLQIVISSLNWYSNTVLSRTSQNLAAKTGRPALDYGHLAKKAFDYSSNESLRKCSKLAMYVVNSTVLVYQLGSCAVPIVFVATNLNNIFAQQLDIHMTIVQYASLLLLPLILVNMISRMRIISWLAVLATLLWMFGTATMLQECFRMPSQWRTVPAYTDLSSTILFIGTAMYSYEGQAMILPVENKLRHPKDFTARCGVLPTLMILVTVFYTALGFYGYTAFGENTLVTLPLNMPDTPLFTVTTIALTIMAILAHPINLYVILEMFWPGFQRKSMNRYPSLRNYPQSLDFSFRLFWVFLTYFLAASIPRIDQIVSIVGVTAGTLCAFCYPMILSVLQIWCNWDDEKSRTFLWFKISFNLGVCVLGLVLVIGGLYVNIIDLTSVS